MGLAFSLYTFLVIILLLYTLSSDLSNYSDGMDGEVRTQAHHSCDAQAPLLAFGSRIVITTTKPASFGTSNSVGALEACLKSKIGSVAAFDEAHGTVRVNVDYAVNGDSWTHGQLVSDSHMDAEARPDIEISSVAS